VIVVRVASERSGPTERLPPPGQPPPRCTGCSQAVQCSYHGWTWDLDGSDSSRFPAVGLSRGHRRSGPLREVAARPWNGWVFVNLDPRPARWRASWRRPHLAVGTLALASGWKAVHVAKIVPCNWKLALQSSIEFLPPHHEPSHLTPLRGRCQRPARCLRPHAPVHQPVRCCQPVPGDPRAGRVDAMLVMCSRTCRGER